jgi:hypothetical protein
MRFSNEERQVLFKLYHARIRDNPDPWEFIFRFSYYMRSDFYHLEYKTNNDAFYKELDSSILDCY